MENGVANMILLISKGVFRMNILRITVTPLLMISLLACGLAEELERRREEGIVPPSNTRSYHRITPPSRRIERPLPDFVVAGISAAQARFGGESTNISRIVGSINISRRVKSADSLFFTSARPIESGAVVLPTCSNRSCFFTFPGFEDLVFSLDNPRDLSLIDDEKLFGYNYETTGVMIDEGITLVQSRTAARQDDDTRLAFQSYGGWIEGFKSNSMFGLERITVSKGGTTTSWDAAFSFGDSSGTNPAGTGRAVWRGVFIGTHAGNNRISQGVAEIDIDDFDSPSVDLVVSGVLDVNSRSQTSVSNEWHDMPLTNGTFHHNNSAVVGSFYERDHEEVGGVVNDRGWIGAFGGTRRAIRE